MQPKELESLIQVAAKAGVSHLVVGDIKVAFKLSVVEAQEALVASQMNAPAPITPAAVEELKSAGQEFDAWWTQTLPDAPEPQELE